MKLYKIAILLQLTFYGMAFSQTLETQFNDIASNHEMIGGSLVVFCKDGIIENLSYGKADYNRNIPVTNQTKYRIASISKTITAIAIMQLVEQNLLSLDDDIGSILNYEVKNPNYPNTAINVRMLLSHTSSIIDGSTYSSFMQATVNNNPIPDLSEIISPGGSYYTIGQFTNTVPGTYFNYSNLNYVILGTIVEKISGQRFDIYCKQNICEPLNIDASFNVNDLTDINQLAVLYRKIYGVWTPQADNFQGIQPVFTNLEGYIPGTNGGRFAPQGGFRCSAEDLAKIFITLLNKGSYNEVRILSEETCSEMFTSQWNYNGTNGNNYYGLFRNWGLGVHITTSTSGGDIVLASSTSMFGHPGEAYGLVSDAYIDTLRQIGFIFITNGVGTGYQTNNYSAFYTVEQDVFDAVENFSNFSVCNTIDLNLSTKTYTEIFPNPFDQILFIISANVEKIRIYDLTGKMIYENNSPEKFTSIDIQNFKPSFYFIEIKTNNTNQITKIVKL
ncbi:MAG TPA: serine hydrolase [Bacteroidales bacterium]|nr:serine hydrolase [Bacteroidales bacterium]HRT79553.1 serine hydrolase [Bacteroidales bacterium]